MYVPLIFHPLIENVALEEVVHIRIISIRNGTCSLGDGEREL